MAEKEPSGWTNAICVECGSAFYRTHLGRKICSDVCRKLRSNRQSAESLRRIRATPKGRRRARELWRQDYHRNIEKNRKRSREYNRRVRADPVRCEIERQKSREYNDRIRKELSPVYLRKLLKARERSTALIKERGPIVKSCCICGAKIECRGSHRTCSAICRKIRKKELKEKLRKSPRYVAWRREYRQRPEIKEKERRSNDARRGRKREHSKRMRIVRREEINARRRKLYKQRSEICLRQQREYKEREIARRNLDDLAELGESLLKGEIDGSKQA